MEQHLIEANNTMLLVGSIQEIRLREELLGTDGSLDIEKAGTVAISALDGYHKTEVLDKLDYVRVDPKDRRADQ
ncbi:hypothetical protein [Fodinibius salsisoli]|uniref:Uncharacterized protein n=1 Tax=Fodinibius salsisoli TaxID=2820877 RepID=A0ABT3PLA9_9BACT|nr:hypothetical protein [Fodinibius salsisoli]MCW9706543.1 hypothetical protein [Fodinibius salsisoli]